MYDVDLFGETGEAILVGHHVCPVSLTRCCCLICGLRSCLSRPVIWTQAPRLFDVQDMSPGVLVVFLSGVSRYWADWHDGFSNETNETSSNLQICGLLYILYPEHIKLVVGKICIPCPCTCVCGDITPEHVVQYTGRSFRIELLKLALRPCN